MIISGYDTTVQRLLVLGIGTGHCVYLNTRIGLYPFMLVSAVFYYQNSKWVVDQICFSYLDSVCDDLVNSDFAVVLAVCYKQNG